MKPYIKISLFVVFFIALIGILAALMMYNKKHADMSKARPDFIVTAANLQKEFEENETAASTRYINKTLEVTGTIVSVTPADTRNTNISLKTSNETSSVICTLPSTGDLSNLKSGDQITLRGECSGFLMDVLLNNCAIVILKK